MGWVKVEKNWKYEDVTGSSEWANNIWFEDDGQLAMCYGAEVTFITLPEDIAIFQRIENKPITKDALEGDGYGSVSRMDGEVVEMAKVIGLYTITVSLEDGSVNIYHNGVFGESEMTFWNVPTVDKLHLLLDMLGVGDG